MQTLHCHLSRMTMYHEYIVRTYYGRVALRCSSRHATNQIEADKGASSSCFRDWLPVSI